jgi:hypothetical protein
MFLPRWQIISPRAEASVVAVQRRRVHFKADTNARLQGWLGFYAARCAEHRLTGGMQFHQGISAPTRCFSLVSSTKCAQLRVGRGWSGSFATTTKTRTASHLFPGYGKRPLRARAWRIRFRWYGRGVIRFAGSSSHQGRSCCRDLNRSRPKERGQQPRRDKMSQSAPAVSA